MLDPNKYSKNMAKQNIFNHFFIIIYKANKIKKAIIKPKRAIASVKAKPNTVQINNCFVSKGFLEIAKISAENTKPIPTPEPINEIVARPAPINLEHCNNMF